MKIHITLLWVGLGALIALSNTVNTMIAGILNPILGAVKGSYV